MGRDKPFAGDSIKLPRVGGGGEIAAHPLYDGIIPERVLKSFPFTRLAP
jgi:hypothetical protein